MSQAAISELNGVLLQAALQSDDAELFLKEFMPQLASLTEADQLLIARGSRGHWQTFFQLQESALPVELLSDALDQERAVQSGHWYAWPLPSSRNDELLVLQTETESAAELASALLPALGMALHAVRQREKDIRKTIRLEALLEMVVQWNQSQDMETLLHQMAETSTSLIQAERASIFLWDKPNKMLVGRPALGVEGNELRIPEDTGLVGKVVHSGETLRADEQLDEAQIDRKVDQKLDFETRTLLCTPLLGRDGEILGAFEMINKKGGNFQEADEVTLKELAGHAAVALQNTQQLETLVSQREQMTEQAAAEVELIGQCAAMERLKQQIARVAPAEISSVLVLGENGTGKEVVSKLIHYQSSRRQEQLIAVNCAALTETLLESELFGHEKGAFTDAHDTRIGKFEVASGGTLFLDEIGDMSLSGQAKLLRVLEERIVIRVGGNTPIAVDTRVIAATNQDLSTLVREKKFREDLYYRLNVVTLLLPPLRERGDDIPMLAESFLKNFSLKAGRRVPKLMSSARKRLKEHTWPGNVRELRNLMERITYLTTEDQLEAEDIDFILAPNSDASTVPLDLALAEATKRFQAEYIKKHIETSSGNMTAAARRLGLHRSNLYRKMKQLEMTDTESEHE